MKRAIHFLLPFVLVFVFLATGTQYSQAQENRSYNGSTNNLQNSDWGAVGTNQIQYCDIGFTDGISAPSGLDRPNPRIISNMMFHQDDPINDGMRLSDYAWVWGQFIDHDITVFGK